MLERGAYRQGCVRRCACADTRGPQNNARPLIRPSFCSPEHLNRSISPSKTTLARLLPLPIDGCHLPKRWVPPNERGAPGRWVPPTKGWVSSIERISFPFQQTGVLLQRAYCFGETNPWMPPTGDANKGDSLRMELEASVGMALR